MLPGQFLAGFFVAEGKAFGHLFKFVTIDWSLIAQKVTDFGHAPRHPVRD